MKQGNTTRLVAGAGLLWVLVVLTQKIFQMIHAAARGCSNGISKGWGAVQNNDIYQLIIALGWPVFFPIIETNDILHSKKHVCVCVCVCACARVCLKVNTVTCGCVRQQNHIG